MFPGKQQTRPLQPVDRKLGLCASPPKATASGNPESTPHSSVCGALVSPTSICSLAMPRVGDQLRGSLPGSPRWLSEGSSPGKAFILGVQLCWPQAVDVPVLPARMFRAPVCPCLLGAQSSPPRGVCWLACGGKCPSGDPLTLD